MNLAGFQRSPLPAGIVAGACEQFEAVRDDLAPGTWSWVGEQLQRLDGGHQRSIARLYRKEIEQTRRDKVAGRWSGSVEHEANNRMRNFVGDYVIHDLCLTAGDGEIVTFCDARVAECKKIIYGTDCDGRRLRMLALVLERYRLQWMAPWSVLEFGPANLEPLYARLTCPRWWRRQVRRLQAREVEKVARARQKVGRMRDLYVSDWNVRRMQKAQKRNQRILSSVEAENDHGQVFTLDELQGKGVSNPGIRRKEFMTRMRGFEEVAQLYGHAGEFWTFTTPSRFHRMTVRGSKKGRKGSGFAVANPNWRGQTPADGQKWLCLQWSRIRAAFDRADIRCYGFRIAEPHHDGTPHWHMVLFFDPEQVRQARRIARHYLWRMDTPKERGAFRRRFDAKAIGGIGKDGKPRTATGYLAKYIGKNINAANIADLPSDEGEGVTLGDSVPRVLSWANTWGIRQFQQIGGPSVTVWRELRRLDGYDVQMDMFDMQTSPWLSEAAEAADAGDWFSFVIAMGGPVLPRNCRPMSPAYWIESRILESGEAVPGRAVTEYGDEAKGSVFGVWFRCEAVLTRFWRWTLRVVKRIGEAPAESLEIMRQWPRADLLRRASAPPWTCVNNCTG